MVFNSPVHANHRDVYLFLHIGKLFLYPFLVDQSQVPVALFFCQRQLIHVAAVGVGHDTDFDTIYLFDQISLFFTVVYTKNIKTPAPDIVPGFKHTCKLSVQLMVVGVVDDIKPHKLEGIKDLRRTIEQGIAGIIIPLVCGGAFKADDGYIAFSQILFKR